MQNMLDVYHAVHSETNRITSLRLFLGGIQTMLLAQLGTTAVAVSTELFDKIGDVFDEFNSNANLMDIALNSNVGPADMEGAPMILEVPSAPEAPSAGADDDED